MDLTKTEYAISKATLEKVLEALEENWFSGEERNDDIMDAEKALKDEIDAQGR